MKIFNNKIIPEAGYLLKENGWYKLKSVYNDKSKYEEEKITNIESDELGVIFNGVLMIEKDNLDKGSIVKMLFNNDEQIAIMLNKDSSKEDEKLFDTMQEWRKYISIILNK